MVLNPPQTFNHDHSIPAPNINSPSINPTPSLGKIFFSYIDPIALFHNWDIMLSRRTENHLRVRTDYGTFVWHVVRMCLNVDVSLCRGLRVE